MTDENNKDDKAEITNWGDKHVWKVTIDAPIETVWNTLVKTDEVLPFLFGAVCETTDGLRPGRKMRMVTKDKKFASVFGEVIEFSPPHRYVHSMSFTQVEGEQPARTAYELKEVPGGTELTLTTECLPNTETGKMISAGQMIVDNLKKLIETGKPAFSGSMIMLLSPFMGFFTPKRCRIENWPLESDETN